MNMPKKNTIRKSTVILLLSLCGFFSTPAQPAGDAETVAAYSELAPAVFTFVGIKNDALGSGDFVGEWNILRTFVGK